MLKAEKIIKDHILNEIFFDFPTGTKSHPFDFFMRSDIDDSESVNRSPLNKYWGFEVSDAYELEDIRSIRGLMQSKLNSLENLEKELLNALCKSIDIPLDDFDDENKFYDFIQNSNATLHCQGEPNEYATVITVNKEDI